MSRPIIRNRETALYLGTAAWLVGAVLLWDAWEARGRRRPLLVRVAQAVG